MSDEEELRARIEAQIAARRAEGAAAAKRERPRRAKRDGEDAGGAETDVPEGEEDAEQGRQRRRWLQRRQETTQDYQGGVAAPGDEDDHDDPADLTPGRRDEPQAGGNRSGTADGTIRPGDPDLFDQEAPPPPPTLSTPARAPEETGSVASTSDDESPTQGPARREPGTPLRPDRPWTRRGDEQNDSAEAAESRPESAADRSAAQPEPGYRPGRGAMSPTRPWERQARPRDEESSGPATPASEAGRGDPDGPAAADEPRPAGSLRPQRPWTERRTPPPATAEPAAIAERDSHPDPEARNRPEPRLAPESLPPVDDLGVDTESWRDRRRRRREERKAGHPDEAQIPPRLETPAAAAEAPRVPAEPVRVGDSDEDEDTRYTQAAQLAEARRRAEAARLAEEVRREEEARRAELARRAEEQRREEQRRAEEQARLAQERRREEEARRVELERRAEEERQAEEARRQQEEREAEARLAEERRRAEEARAEQERQERVEQERQARQDEERRKREERVRQDEAERRRAEEAAAREREEQQRRDEADREQRQAAEAEQEERRRAAAARQLEEQRRLDEQRRAEEERRSSEVEHLSRRERRRLRHAPPEPEPEPMSASTPPAGEPLDVGVVLDEVAAYRSELDRLRAQIAALSDEFASVGATPEEPGAEPTPAAAGPDSEAAPSPPPPAQEAVDVDVAETVQPPGEQRVETTIEYTSTSSLAAMPDEAETAAAETTEAESAEAEPAEPATPAADRDEGDRPEPTGRMAERSAPRDRDDFEPARIWRSGTSQFEPPGGGSSTEPAGTLADRVPEARDDDRAGAGDSTVAEPTGAEPAAELGDAEAPAPEPAGAAGTPPPGTDLARRLAEANARPPSEEFDRSREDENYDEPAVPKPSFRRAFRRFFDPASASRSDAGAEEDDQGRSTEPTSDAVVAATTEPTREPAAEPAESTESFKAWLDRAAPEDPDAAAEPEERAQRADADEAARADTEPEAVADPEPVTVPIDITESDSLDLHAEAGGGEDATDLAPDRSDRSEQPDASDQPDQPDRPAQPDPRDQQHSAGGAPGGPVPGSDLPRRLAQANAEALARAEVRPQLTDAPVEPRAEERRAAGRTATALQDRPPEPAEREATVIRPRRAKGGRTGTVVRNPAVRFAFVLGLIVALALLLRAFVLSPYYIPSASMEQTLHGCSGCNNDHVLVNKLAYHVHAVHRGDVVVFKRPVGWDVSDKVLIKRVIGLPGDVLTERGGTVYVNGDELVEPYVDSVCQGGTQNLPRTVVPAADVFVMGDDRCQSADSRTFGPVPKSAIIGRAFLIIWPLGRIHWL